MDNNTERVNYYLSQVRRYIDEAKHWIEYDSSENVLRLGLVSGGSATLPNIFPIYDLVDPQKRVCPRWRQTINDNGFIDHAASAAIH